MTELSRLRGRYQTRWSWRRQAARAQRPIPTESVAITEVLWQALARWRELQEEQEQTKGRRP
jgi:hypothetical protein